MVKTGKAEVKEGFEDFVEVAEEYGITQEGGKTGKTVEREGLDKVRDLVRGKVKLSLKVLKTMQMAVWMNLNGEAVDGFEGFIERIAKKVLDEVKKTENVNGDLVLCFLKEFGVVLRGAKEVSKKFLIRVMKVLKKSGSVLEDKELLKVLVIHFFKNQSKEEILHMIQVLGNSIKEFWVVLIFTFAINLEDSQVTPQELIEYSLISAKGSLKNDLNLLLEFLTNFSSVETTNSLHFFRVLLLVSDLILGNTKYLTQYLPKILQILVRSLNQSDIPKNYPQKVQILQKMTELEQKSEVYLPGTLPYLYEILASQLFFKRSKSMRVAQVDFKFKLHLSAEEQSSEIYKQSLLDWIITSLQTHLRYLKSKHPSSLSIVKVQLDQLQASVSPSVFARLKPLIKL